MPQHPTLFRGTVAENIRLGDPGADDDRVRLAAELAGAHDFVSALPQAYETVVGDGGRQLSAGQRRRLALARAFLRDAPLVLLDEPTADLDPASAALVADAIDRLRVGRTVLLVATRSRARCAGGSGRPPRSAAASSSPPRRRHDARSAVSSRSAAMPRGRIALSIALGALAVGFGVALMTTAGYLISRAAEQPPILALTTIIVVVRFLALARPLARYLERLASHDLALRALGRIRATVYERIEPLAPAELDAFRRGDLVSRMVGDVDALQGLYLRGLAPPLVALRRRGCLRRRDGVRRSRLRRSCSRPGSRSAGSRFRSSPAGSHDTSAGARPRRAAS